MTTDRHKHQWSYDFGARDGIWSCTCGERTALPESEGDARPTDKHLEAAESLLDDSDASRALVRDIIEAWIGDRTLYRRLPECEGCGYSQGDCTIAIRKGKLACCPDCRHEVKVEVGDE